MDATPSAADLQRRNEELLRRLELVITRRLNGMLHGDHRGLTPQVGTEPGEERLYLPGDDVRRIDWNVTARMQTPYIRQTIADRELDTWILCDLSASIGFGTAQCEKRDLVLAAAAGIGFLAAGEGNRIGAVLATPERTRVIPARGGRPHLLGMLREIMHTEPPRSGSIDLEAAMHSMGALARRRGLCVVISDFLAEPGWARGLRRLTSRHDVLVVSVLDPRELELPDVGLLTLIDVESGQMREIQTGSRKLRTRYAEAAAAQRAQTESELRRAGADLLELRTDRDWFRDMVTFVVERRRRASHPVTSHRAAGAG